MKQHAKLHIHTMAKKKEKKTIVILDTHAIIHRAYHALPDFVSNTGEPTGALFGLSTMLIKIIGELKPDYIIATFDLKGPTHRHEVYEEYKAGRKETDDALVTQIDRSRDLFEAFSIPIYEAEGFEADDVLGTIANDLHNNTEHDVVIASGDMDTLQLVKGDRVRVYTLKRGIKDTIIYNEDAVEERFSFGPELLPDYKGLRGDPSDNIKGIKGIGEKTATTLITSFGSVEDIYKKLAKDEEAFKSAGLTPRIINLLKEGEEDARFSKTLATIRLDAPVDFSLPEKEWKEEVSPENILNLFDELTFRTLGARVEEMFSLEDRGKARQQSLNEIKEKVDDGEIERVGIALWLLDSTISNPTLDDILRYASTRDFKKAKEQILQELHEKQLMYVYEKIELPLIPILKKMTKEGVLIDKDFLKNISKKYHEELAEIQTSIFKQAGETFNLNSPKQLGEILFGKMQIQGDAKIKKTSTGSYSTRESELQKLSDKHTIIKEILEYRELQKLLSTYIDTLPEQLDEEDRLHATFVQTGTSTGRLSSQNPNVQNIPIRTEKGRIIRNAFTAPKGSSLVAIDYSQIELRIAAVLSKDEKLLEIFKNNEDIHSQVAAEVFGVSPEEVDKGMRAKAKTINFGILYGMGVNALKKNIGSTQKEARDFYDRYFKTFTGISKFIDEQKAFAHKNGYTETLFGRRRYFEGIDSKLPFVRAQAERMAINAPIQGTQADIIKRAMIKIDEHIQKEDLSGEIKMLLQVHDELVFEIPTEKAEKHAKALKEIMEDVIPTEDTEGITFIANAGVGPHWGDLKEIE